MAAGPGPRCTAVMGRNSRRVHARSVLLCALLLVMLPTAGVAGGAASWSQGPMFRIPLPPPPAVLTAFRPPSHRYGAGHRGVDLAASAGDPITAAGAGTVIYAGRLVDRGVVSVEHASGLRTTYEPVTAVVRAGMSVGVGALLGTLEAGHGSCAPADCLHWGARLPDDVYLDPLSLLGPLPVRLLPWDG